MNINNEVKKVYTDYLLGLRKFPKTYRLPTGETVESEIKRVTKHLKTLKG